MFTTTNIRIYNPLSILFILLVSSTILTVGLPIPRQEHETGSDIIAGEDFLSILMDAHHRNLHHTHGDTAHRADKQHHDEDTAISTSPTVPSTASPQTFKNMLNDEYINNKNPIILDSTRFTSDRDTPASNSSDDKNYIKDEEDGTIISVRVSSTVGHSMINKRIYASNNENNFENVESTADKFKLFEDKYQEKGTMTIGSLDNNEPNKEAIPSEDMPSLIAEANKSDFSVDEVEPISRAYDAMPSPLPYEGKPFQETVIYHNQNPNNRARSVSYSTVIQTIPSIQKPWDGIQSEIPGVQNNTINMQLSQGIPTQSAQLVQPPHPQTAPHIPLNSNPSETVHSNGPQTMSLQPQKSTNSAAESKDYYITSKYNPAEYNESIDKINYESSSHRYYSPEPTERNWGTPEENYQEQSKPYSPIVYGQPEQNYEVDEAVSVETNGRVHGVQQTHHDGEHKPPKKDDNQKVGYVVEGRNYRKYRVEERTSDGFIVGEYGVVRHDDGSLRGVRYTADGTISPRLIYDALMKFLAL